MLEITTIIVLSFIIMNASIALQRIYIQMMHGYIYPHFLSVIAKSGDDQKGIGQLSYRHNGVLGNWPEDGATCTKAERSQLDSEI